MDDRAELALQVTAVLHQFWVAYDAADEFKVIDVDFHSELSRLGA